jgi:peroxiredoxin
MMPARLGVFGATAGALLLFATDPGAQTMPGQIPTPAKVADFTLIDAQQQQPHELYKMASDKAVVLVSTGVGCPIARSMTPVIKALRDKYAAKGVEVMMVDSNLQDSRAAIAAEAKEFGIDIPILMDKTQAVGEALGVTRTAEVFVVTPKTWKIAYHGPLDDRSDYGASKASSKAFADVAITAVLAGQPAPAATQASKGCLIDFPAPVRTAKS